jgi:integrase
MSNRPAVTRTTLKALTERDILAMQPGDKRTDGDGKPGTGRLIVKARTRKNNGQPVTIREFFFRYWNAEGAERLVLVGTHGTKTLREARRTAHTLRELVGSGVDPQFHLQQQEQAHRAAEKAAREAAAQEALKGTLEDLLNAYAGHLKAAGKASAADVLATLKRHVIVPFPELAARKARDITADDISDILAKMISKGIERRTNIVRSLLRSAFTFGTRQDNDPERKAEALRNGTTAVAKRYGITGNPVADVARVGRFDKAGDRTLTDAELKAYLKAIDALHPSIRDTLRTALLLGGQRMSQLLRATWKDYDVTEGTLTLTDAKGRGTPREHVLPVSEKVAAILVNLRERNTKGDFIFSAKGGKKPIDLATLSNAVSAIGRAEDPDHPERGYTASDLRRTVETRLAALGVSKDHRAIVLSHGRTADVQAKHYERHDDIPAKAAVLALWESHIEAVEKGKQTGRVIRGRFRAATAPA